MKSKQGSRIAEATAGQGLRRGEGGDLNAMKEALGCEQSLGSLSELFSQR